MIVVTARVVLSLPGNDSLKGKRKVLRRVIDRVRHRYNVAIAEVASMDEHRRAVLGLAVVSNDAAHGTSMLDKILDFVEASSHAPVVERRTEVLHLGTGDHFGIEAEWDLEAEERWLAGSDDG